MEPLRDLREKCVALCLAIHFSPLFLFFSRNFFFSSPSPAPRASPSLARTFSILWGVESLRSIAAPLPMVPCRYISPLPMTPTNDAPISNPTYSTSSICSGRFSGAARSGKSWPFGLPSPSPAFTSLRLRKPHVSPHLLAPSMLPSEPDTIAPPRILGPGRSSPPLLHS
jgi:hypothetical protein